MLKLVGMVSNDNYSYLVFLNTFLSLTCGHVKIGMYDKERLLITPFTSKYFVIPSQCTFWDGQVRVRNAY